jgi:hypothetical protein
MPSVLKEPEEPEEMAAPWSSGRYVKSASAPTSATVRPVSSSIVVRAQRLSTRWVSTSGSSARFSSSRTPNTAPVAPVMPTISRTVVGSLGSADG